MLPHNKLEAVKKQMNFMKLEKTENGYYARWRKSKNNKAMIDDLFEFEDVMQEDGWNRIGEYEVTLTEKAVEDIYARWRYTFMCREF